jgi:hypothetical protein
MGSKQVFILWDIDGTLVLGTNTSTIHLNAFKYVFSELFGRYDTPEVFAAKSVTNVSILTQMKVN